MESFKGIVVDVVMVYENGVYWLGVNVVVDYVVEVVKKYIKWIVLVVVVLIEVELGEFEDILVDWIDEFLEDWYLGFGVIVGDVLWDYVEDDLNFGCNGVLGCLYDVFDKVGGVDCFDWGLYVDDGMIFMIGMYFVVMLVLVGELGVYIFGS